MMIAMNKNIVLVSDTANESSDTKHVNIAKHNKFLDIQTKHEV